MIPRFHSIARSVICSFGALLLGLSCGCQSFQPPATGGPSPGAVTISLLAGIAADIGTHATLQAQPQYRPAFVAAEIALTALIDARDFDPAKFAAELQHLPVDALNANFGTNSPALYVSSAVVIWNGVTQLATRIDQGEVVRTTMIAVRDGIARGLL